MENIVSHKTHSHCKIQNRKGFFIFFLRRKKGRKKQNKYNPAGHKTAAEEKHQAGSFSTVGREGGIAVQPQRIRLADGIGEGFLLDLLCAGRRRNPQRGK